MHQKKNARHASNEILASENHIKQFYQKVKCPINPKTVKEKYEKTKNLIIRDRIRTCNLSVRSRTRYPLRHTDELQEGRKTCFIYCRKGRERSQSCEINREKYPCARNHTYCPKSMRPFLLTKSMELDSNFIKLPYTNYVAFISFKPKMTFNIFRTQFAIVICKMSNGQVSYLSNGV